jgi:hypothetical protein
MILAETGTAKSAPVAMEVYAKQAKDGKLIAYATEIRKRAERWLGELMEADRKAGRLAKGNAVKGAKPGRARGKKGQKSAGRARTRAFKSFKDQGFRAFGAHGQLQK